MFDARPAAARRRFPAWSLGLGLLLGLNLLALIYAFVRDDARSTTRDAEPAVAAAALATPTAPPVAAPVTAPVTASVAAPAASPTIARTAAPAPSLPQPAPPAAPARTRDDLLAAGDAVPDARLSLHVYDADPARRFVFLNGQRLGEGDIAANGLRVVRIDADGVVLDHRGSDFKVRLDP